MLAAEISGIIYHLQAKGINPSMPGHELLQQLARERLITKTNFLIYDFELRRLVFANERASDFLNLGEKGGESHEDSFFEGVLHPISYQLLHLNAHSRTGQNENFEGLFYLKAPGRNKYEWVHASARVINFNSARIAKLIYICFVEVDRAIGCYLDVTNASLHIKHDTPLINLLHSLKDREVQLLNLVAAECTTKDIADKLNITQVAVDSARKRLIKKFKVKSVVGLVKVAMALGLTGMRLPSPVEAI